MAGDITLLDDVHIVHFRNSENETLETRLRNLGRISEFCAEHKSNKIILELKNDSKKPNLKHAYTFARFFRKWRKGFKIAVVYSSDNIEMSFIRELVMNHSGKNLRRKPDIQSAISWLTES